MADPITPPGVDPQDPLPEGRWLWRRLIVFASVAAAYGLLFLAVRRALPEDMAGIARDLMILLGVILLFYLVAPSANQIAELLATLKLRLRGPRRDDAQVTESRTADCDPPEPDHRSDEHTPPWERRR